MRPFLPAWWRTVAARHLSPTAQKFMERELLRWTGLQRSITLILEMRVLIQQHFIIKLPKIL
jgi:hypothetical protein